LPKYRRQNQLAADNVDWAKKLANDTRRKYGLLYSEHGELESAALEALVVASRRYDPKNVKGLSFTEYAHSRVFGAVLDTYRLAHPQGRWQDGKLYGTRRIPSQLHEEIASDRPEDDIGAFQWQSWRSKQLVAREPTPEEALELSEAARDLQAWIATLKPVHAKVCHLRFVDGLLLRTIGRKMGLTESRISQIVKESLDALREKHGQVVQ
jgi:RNA polymerase sigma factor (sigma-70 family)